jgi:hypothetical protein
MRVAKQGTLEFKSWGGARKGAGRKREGTRSRVAHVARPVMKPSQPSHITLRITPGLKSLRCRSEYEVVREALVAGSDRFGLRVVEYSVLSSRVGLGRCRPRPPTDPDVRDSRIRLLGAAGSLRWTHLRVDGVCLG